MTKLLLAGLAVFALINSPVNAQTAPAARPQPRATKAALPMFAFKQAVAGATMDPNLVGNCSPSSDGVAGSVECSGSDDVVAGISLLVAPTYYFFENRLTSMLFLYDNNSTNFLTLLEAFTTKYGVPCKTATEKWQSRGGITLDNSTATWCFKTGTLRLEQIGPQRDYGLVAYTDTHKAPTKSAPTDF